MSEATFYISHPDGDIEIEKCGGAAGPCPIITFTNIYSEKDGYNCHAKIEGKETYSVERFRRMAKLDLIEFIGRTHSICKSVGKEKFLQKIHSSSASALCKEFDYIYKGRCS